MTTKELLEIVKSRGLKIVLINGQPVLDHARGNPGVTAKLLSALRIHRERIKEWLERESATNR